MTARRIGVGLGECKFGGQDDVLVAIGLGSCVAVTAHEPDRKVGGLAHIVLPDGRDADNDSGARYARPGVALLLGQLLRHGAVAGKIRVQIAGGAAILAQSDTFNVGARNIEAVKQAIASKGLQIAGEDTGGNISRTVEFDVASGRVMVQHGEQRWSLGAHPATTPTSNRQRVILIVDDSSFVRARCRSILTEHGYTVLEADNGQEATTTYERAHPQAVFMDITMPVKDGLTALREIRASDPRARIAMMTATDQQAAIINALRMGAIDFVAKPFPPERLVEIAGKLLAA